MFVGPPALWGPPVSFGVICGHNIDCVLENLVQIRHRIPADKLLSFRPMATQTTISKLPEDLPQPMVQSSLP
jgi:hypothetical protein